MRSLQSVYSVYAADWSPNYLGSSATDSPLRTRIEIVM